MEPGPRRLLTRSQALRLAGFATLAFVIIAAQGLSMVIHSDSAQDFELAKGCKLGPEFCYSHRTSVEQLKQGRLLLFALNWMQDVGIEGRFALAAFSVLTATGVGLLGEMTARLFALRTDDPGRIRTASLCVVALMSFALPWVVNHPVMWNPTFGTLPLCLWTVSVAALTSEREELASAGVAISSVLAYHGHIVYVVVWFAALPVVGALTKGWRGPALALVGTPVLALLIDAPSVLQNRAFVGQSVPGGTKLVLAAPVLLLGLGLALRGPLGKLRERLGSLAGWVATAACGFACVLALYVVVRALGRPMGPRYLAPGLPAVGTVIIAWAAFELWRVRSWAPLLVSAAVMLATYRARKQETSEYMTVAGLRRLDAALGGSGPLAINTERIRGYHGGIMTEMMLAIDRDHGPVRSADGTVLQVMELMAEECPPPELEWGCLEVAPGQTFVWREDLSPWFSTTHLEIADGARRPYEWQALSVDRGNPYMGREEFGDTQRFLQRVEFEAGVGPRMVLLESGWRVVSATGGQAEAFGEYGGAEWVSVQAREGAKGTLTIEYINPPVGVRRRPSIALELSEADLEALFTDEIREGFSQSAD